MKLPLGKGLRGRIARSLMVMVLAFTAAFLLVMRLVATRGMERFVLGEVLARHDEAASGITLVLDELSLLYSRLVLSDEILLLLQDPTLPPAERERLFAQMLERAGVNRRLFGAVGVVYGGQVVGLWGDVSEWALSEGPPGPSAWGRAYVERVLTSGRLVEPGGIVWDREGEAYLLVGKRMVNFPTASVTGAVVFFVREAALRELVAAASGGLGRSLVVTGDALVITHTEGQGVGARLFDAGLLLQEAAGQRVREADGSWVLAVTSPLRPLAERYGLEWRIMSLIPQEALLHDVILLNRYSLVLGVTMAVAAALLSLPLSSGVAGPIRRMVERLRRFSRTGQKEPAQVRDELWELEATYDEMVERITELMQSIRERMEAQRKLELDALQMQINPHFLYNTLDAMAWMAKLEGQPQIARLAIALARFFRISLHKGDKYITVAEEIELVKHFIEIELIRFPDKFTVSYHVEADVERELTLKLLLQPIVENAIKHGVSLLEAGGHIEIKAYGDSEHVWYEVIDDGVGFEPPGDLLSATFVSGKGGGYGLRNVDERIKLEYGPDCGVQVFSQVNQGTRVVLKIKRSSAASAPAAGQGVS